jgi:cytochrome c551/c552
MFKSLKTLLSGGLAAVWMAAGSQAVAATTEQISYGFGTPATAEQIAAWNIDVRPDGAGLPVGHGSVEEGQSVYDQKCVVCHGTFGESGDYIQLAGGVGSLHGEQPVRTVGSLLPHATTLWDYINRAMPFPNSNTLTANEVYAVTAYVLNLNDIVPAGTTLDEKSLPLVNMPNRNGFTTNHGFMTVQGKPDMTNSGCMRNCAAVVRVTSQLPPNFVAQNYGDISKQFRGLATMSARTAGTAGEEGDQTAPKKDGETLAHANGCTLCHGVDHKIVGPAFRDVAAKYRGSQGALDTLTHKVRAGGAGNWGDVPMPPQTAPSDADLMSIVTWVLAGAPST